MQMHGRMEVQFQVFLTQTLDGGESSALLPGRLTAEERAPGTHWIGSWVGPRAGLDAVTKIRSPFPASAGNRTPGIQSVASHYTDWAVRKV
jgi:hypothetical protein